MNWSSDDQTAVHSWVVAASELPPTSVVWAEQDGPRPATPCIVLEVLSVTATGQEAVVHSAVETPTPGQEVLVESKSTLVVSLRVTCFAPSVGDQTKFSLLSRLEPSLSNESIRQILIDANVGVLSVGQTQSAGSTRNTSFFEPRSFIQIELSVPRLQTSYTTNIVTVEIQPEVTP